MDIERSWPSAFIFSYFFLGGEESHLLWKDKKHSHETDSDKKQPLKKNQVEISSRCSLDEW